MKHVSTWLQAALLPERWDVCGVQCASMSVWHVFALGQTGNAYLTGGLPDMDSAAALLIFCSRDMDGGRKLFTETGALGKAMRRVCRKLRKLKFEDVDFAATDYVETCMRAPGHKRQEGEGVASRAAAAPLPWGLVSYLCGGDMARAEAAWNTPYAVARCMFDAARDIRGEDDSLESLEEEQRYDEWEERRKGLKNDSES